MTDLSPIEHRALATLKRGPKSATNVGWDLWGEGGYRGSSCSCPYARPAGKVLAGLRRRGLVARARGGMLHELTAAGRKAAR